ncbi:MAG: ABC transporter permease [Formosimonas sp.]
MNQGSTFAASWRRCMPLLPFALFCLLFLILPALIILLGSVQDAQGRWTLDNFIHLFRPNIISSYWVTIQLSAISAIGGTLLGFAIAYAVHAGGVSHRAQSFILSFSGVASNFAGVPLSFAFIATMGRMGLVTLFLKSFLGIDLYEHGFSLYSFVGLVLVYLYFQIPLMILIIMPAIEALRVEWREAAQNLGASRLRFWWEVVLPILSPSLLSSFLLLFGNAFGAYATAYALTGGMLNLITILIGSQIRGDVLHDPNLGYALAVGMVLIMALTTILANYLKRKSSRWLE